MTLAGNHVHVTQSYNKLLMGI